MNEFYLVNSYIQFLDTPSVIATLPEVSGETSPLSSDVGKEARYFRLTSIPIVGTLGNVNRPPNVPTNAAQSLSPTDDASSNTNNAASNASPGGQAAGSAVISIPPAPIVGSAAGSATAPPAQAPGGGSGY